MWFSFTLITLLGLLRAGTSQDNSSLCINPTNTPMIGLANYEVKMVWTKFVSMRDESENVHASFALSCGREPLVWDDSLALYAYNEVGKKCPTEGKPFVPGFKEGTSTNKEELGIITVFGLDYDFLILGVTSTWDNLINSLEEGKARALSEKYEKGPWDPVFQVLWADTKKVGCAITIYNVSDFQAASKIFNKPVDKNSVPWNLVCAFNPKGSIAGQKAWSYCASSPYNRTTLTTPMRTFKTAPTKRHYTNPPTPHSAGTRLRQALGFNFETITTTILTTLSGILSLIPPPSLSIYN